MKTASLLLVSGLDSWRFQFGGESIKSDGNKTLRWTLRRWESFCSLSWWRQTWWNCEDNRTDSSSTGNGKRVNYLRLNKPDNYDVKVLKCYIQMKPILQVQYFTFPSRSPPGGKTRQVTFKCDWSLGRSPWQPLASCHSSLSRLIGESWDAFLLF